MHFDSGSRSIHVRPGRKRIGRFKQRLAEKLATRKMSDLDKAAVLEAEYRKPDRLWSSIYYRYDLFKSQYDACVNRLLHALRHGGDPKGHKPKRSAIPQDERLAGAEPTVPCSSTMLTSPFFCAALLD